MYIKSIESILSFNILVVSYFYWIAMSLKSNTIKINIIVLIGLSLIILVALSYTFLLNEGIRKDKLIILKNRKTYLMVFAITAYSGVMFIAFFLKSGGSRFLYIEIICSLLAAIFIFLYPLKNKNAVLIFNICVSITEIIVLYKIIYNLYILNYNFVSLTPFFMGTNTLAFFAIVSFAFSLLSCVSLPENLFKYRLLKLFVSLNIIASLLIAILSYSRSVIGSFVIMFIYLFCSTLFFKKSESSSILKLLIGLMVILICFFMLNKSFYLVLLKYFSSLSKFRGSFLDTYRYVIWREAINQIGTHVDTLLFGEPILFLEIQNVNTWHAHNSYLEMIRYAGIFSILYFFIAICTAFLRKGFDFFKKNIFATAVLISLLTHIIFEDFFTGANYHFLIFWAMLECCRNTNLKNNKI